MSRTQRSGSSDSPSPSPSPSPYVHSIAVAPAPSSSSSSTSHHQGHSHGHATTHKRQRLVLTVIIISVFLIVLNWTRLSSLYSNHRLFPGRFQPSSSQYHQHQHRIHTGANGEQWIQIDAPLNHTAALQLSNLGHDGILRVQQLTQQLRALRAQLRATKANSGDSGTTTSSSPSSPPPSSDTSIPPSPKQQPSSSGRKGLLPASLLSKFGKPASSLSKNKERAMYLPPPVGPTRLLSPTIFTSEQFERHFQLIVKVFTFENSDALSRTLQSLAFSEYRSDDTHGSDQVQLEIFIDRRTEFDARNSSVLAVARAFQWQHGRKVIYIHDAPVGKLGQWTSAWKPTVDDHHSYALFIDDSMTVSRYYYTQIKRLIRHCRYTPSATRASPTLDHNQLYGIALQRISFVAGMGGEHTMHEMITTHAQPFMYSMPAVKAQVFFPDHWRAFMQFYFTRRDNPQAKPLLLGTLTDVWYRDESDVSWLPWLMRYAWVTNSYALHMNYRDGHALAVQHVPSSPQSSVLYETQRSEAWSLVRTTLMTTRPLPDELPPPIDPPKLKNKTKAPPPSPFPPASAASSSDDSDGDENPSTVASSSPPPPPPSIHRRLLELQASNHHDDDDADDDRRHHEMPSDRHDDERDAKQDEDEDPIDDEGHSNNDRVPLPSPMQTGVMATLLRLSRTLFTASPSPSPTTTTTKTIVNPGGRTTNWRARRAVPGLSTRPAVTTTTVTRKQFVPPTPPPASKSTVAAATSVGGGRATATNTRNGMKAASPVNLFGRSKFDIDEASDTRVLPAPPPSSSSSTASILPLSVPVYDYCFTRVITGVLEDDDDGLRRMLHARASPLSNGNDGGGMIVVAVVNKHFQDFMYNWLCSLRGINVHTYILYTPDQLFAEQLRDEGYWVYHDKGTGDALLDGNFTAAAVNSLNYGTLDYQRLIFHRTRFIHRILQLNYSVLVADVDAVWRHNPLPYLKQHIGDVDLLGQNDNPKLGQICGGFMLLANTERMKSMWALLVDKHKALILNAARRGKLAGVDDSEQTVLERMMRQHASTFKYRFLPQQLFPNGYEYFTRRQNVLHNAMVVHNNFIVGGDKKRGRFRARQLWYLDDNDLRCTRIFCGTSTGTHGNNGMAPSIDQDLPSIPVPMIYAHQHYNDDRP